MIIDGRKIADEVELEVKETVSSIQNRKPCLAVILVGENAPSKIYVSRKQRACKKVGIESIMIHLPEATSETELLNKIDSLNHDGTVDGILVQLPLPKQINEASVILKISPKKDVDGFHPINVGKMLIGETDGFFSCTPLGIMSLINRSNIETEGKHVVIIGRSNIVGKPMAALLLQRNANATVTVVHSKTKNLKELCLLADIIIVAIGKANFLTEDMVHDGATVIDVGINKIDDKSKSKGYRLVGDADFENLKNKCHAITPVPGGVGPMTIALLLKNTLKSYQNTHE